MTDLTGAAAPIEPRDGEHWAEVFTSDGEGPYRALVPDPQRDTVLTPLFPTEAIQALCRDFDPNLDIYGGIQWVGGDQTVHIFQHADDDQPRLVSPDERGLYALGLDDWGWVEAVASETEQQTAAIEAAEEAYLDRREREHDEALDAIDRYGYGA